MRQEWLVCCSVSQVLDPLFPSLLLREQRCVREGAFPVSPGMIVGILSRVSPLQFQHLCLPLCIPSENAVRKWEQHPSFK